MSTLVESSEVTAVEVSCKSDTLKVVLADGRTVSVPLAWFPRLVDATPKQRVEWELIGGGIGIHWEAIDEDILVASLLRPENFMRLPDVTSQRTLQKSRHIENKTAEQGKGGAVPALEADKRPNNQVVGESLPHVDGKQTIGEQENALRLVENTGRKVTAYEEDDAAAKMNKVTASLVGQHDPQPSPLKLVALAKDANQAAIQNATGDMVLAFKGVAYVGSQEQTVLGLRDK
jgi:hypothetical protein